MQKPDLTSIRNKRGFICDMDGVIYHGSRVLDGARHFVQWLQQSNKQFLFLTNSSARSPRELKSKLAGLGIHVTEDHFITSAMATAWFIASQCPGGRVFVIGDPGLTQALHDAGLVIDESKPDYVVIGETRSYGFEKLELAVRHVINGAKLIGTNPDITGPTEYGISPACRALVAPIELATKRNAYFIGKPNPLIMRHALKLIQCRREETAIIGDRMDTDIIAGIESEIDTILVLSGITQMDDLNNYPYQPGLILNHVGEIAP